MGHVRVTAEIANPVERTRTVRVDNVLVDTGATRTAIPRAIADQLGLEVLGTQSVRTAQGTQRLVQSYALIRIADRQSFNDVWIKDTVASPSIGVITLAAMGLAVEPKNGRLVDADSYLL
jgi:predicted aspartyl protease